MHHRLGDAESLPHPLRVALHLAIDGRAEVGEIDGFVEPGRRPRVAARRPVQLEVAHPRQVRNERRLLDEQAHSAQHRRARAHVLAQQPGMTFVGADEADEHAHRRGLAGAVGPEQAADLAGSTTKLRSCTA